MIPRIWGVGSANEVIGRSVRAFLLGSTPLLPLEYELAILVAFMAVMVPLGFLVFRWVERRCRTLGTLSQH